MHAYSLKQEGTKLIRLWIHEVYRVFSDRLIEENDKVAFFEIVKTRTKDFFQKSVDEVNVAILKFLTETTTLNNFLNDVNGGYRSFVYR